MKSGLGHLHYSRTHHWAASAEISYPCKNCIITALLFLKLRT
jgi:hypothetical protein